MREIGGPFLSYPLKGGLLRAFGHAAYVLEDTPPEGVHLTLPRGVLQAVHVSPHRLQVLLYEIQDALHRSRANSVGRSHGRSAPAR